MTKGLILLGHGSRDPLWSAPMRAIADRVRSSESSLRVEVAFLEFTPPTFPDAIATMIADGVDVMEVAPLFLGQGGHLKRDVIALIDAGRIAHPGVTINILPALGESTSVLDAIAAWLIEARDGEAGRVKGDPPLPR